MEINTSAARPYAKAAFEEAREQGAVEQWSALLGFLGQVVSDPLMQRIIKDPRIGSERLAGLVLDICGERAFAEGGNFIRLLVNAERLLLAAEIARLFEEFRAATEGVAEIEVVSAYELDAEEERSITDAMQQRLGKRIDLSKRVDKALIGGVLIRVGDHVIDASLRGQLEKLAGRLR